MIHLFINALAASAGGGLTYIRNVIPLLAGAPDVRVTVAVGHISRKEFGDFPNFSVLELDIPPGRRFWFEQSRLPNLIRQSGANVLLSTGNFALRNSPVTQILLSRNSIYTSNDYFRDLRQRREYRTWADTHLRSILAKKSIKWADVAVAPSAAFAAELSRWTGRQVVAIHHGFDRAAFTEDWTPLPNEVEEELEGASEALKLLFVSHYNYYRNFETLIRALPSLRERISNRPVKLFLTCQLAAGQNPGTYRPDAAANLVRELGVSEMVVELGAIPYQSLHQVYARADLYVTPAYTETFAHPLVEAMSSGLPIVASDIAVHREICGDAAVYFPRFSPAGLAESINQLTVSPGNARRMATAGIHRARTFSWRTHVDKILDLSRTLIASEGIQTLPCAQL